MAVSRGSGTCINRLGMERTPMENPWPPNLLSQQYIMQKWHGRTSLFAFSRASIFSASRRSSRSDTALAASLTTSLPLLFSMLFVHASHAACSPSYLNRRPMQVQTFHPTLKLGHPCFLKSASPHRHSPIVNTSTPLTLSNVCVVRTYSGGATNFILTGHSSVLVA